MGHSKQWIMEWFNCFCKYAFDLAQKNHLDTPNTVAIVTFVYPLSFPHFLSNLYVHLQLYLAAIIYCYE